MSYKLFQEIKHKIADINYAIAVLNWDQETYIPKNGNSRRAQQISTLAGMAHKLSTSKKLAKVLKKLKQDARLSLTEIKNVKLALKDYKKSKKFTTEFVMKESKAISTAFQAWIAAREADNFELYIPALTEIVNIQREKAEILAYKEHPYNALMDQFEPGATINEIDSLFKDVKEKLTPFTQEIFACEKPDNKFMFQHYEHKKQWDFGMNILAQLGFDFDSGRQDLSEHPFTTSFGVKDVRLTTRVNEENFYDMLWSCIHEGGHGLYEQGLKEEEYGMPCGEAISLGIHESQSRLYENNLGRSKAFWKANYKKLQEIFPENLSNTSFEAYYKGINLVEPSFIRTDADELTYHFHIMIRYEIEKKLIEGSIEVKDLKTIWNDAYKKYLNVEVTSDKEGVLQDVHWAHGGFGYFPTYSLGSFYAAQLFNKAKQDIPNLEAEIEAGNMDSLLAWLREKVHKHGKYFTAKEVCEKATGEALNFKYFLDYAKAKYSEIYGL
ncbi:MAG: carboxypeptidase M32 [Chitinophagales bacterium]